MPSRVAVLLAALAASSGALHAQAVTVVRGATVHTAAGAPIPNATIVVQGGKIAAVGRNVIRNALQLAQEFGLDVIIDGGANAKARIPLLRERKVPVIVGQVSHPFVSHEEIPDMSEYPPADEGAVAKLMAGGVTTAIATFSRAFGSLAPAGSSKWILLDAGIAAGYGLSEEQVLRAVTLVPAEILGVQQRVGSLTVGKDADVIILDGPPLSMKTWVERVYVGGTLVHTRVDMR